MAKDYINDYSPTAGNNTDVGGVDIAENCAPSGINNAIREVMSHLAGFKPQFEAGADVASASTLPVNVPGILHDVTGTTTIAALATPTNDTSHIKILQFNGALTLTDSANLILPAGNITTVAGDVAMFVYEGSSVWRNVSFYPSGGFGTASSENIGTTTGTIPLNGGAASFSALNVVGDLDVGGLTTSAGLFSLNNSDTPSNTTGIVGGRFSTQYLNLHGGATANYLSSVSQSGAPKNLVIQHSTDNASTFPVSLTFLSDGSGIDLTGDLDVSGLVTADTKGFVAGSVPGSSGVSGWSADVSVGTALVLSSVKLTSEEKHYGFINPNGEVGSIRTLNNNTSYNTSSDYRLKEITGEIDNSGEFIDGLRPVKGSWKTDGSPFSGFLAHEFAEVSPGSVTGEKDEVDEEGNPVYQAMDAGTPEVIANLVAEIQSLRQRVADLEEE